MWFEILANPFILILFKIHVTTITLCEPSSTKIYLNINIKMIVQVQQFTEFKIQRKTTHAKQEGQTSEQCIGRRMQHGTYNILVVRRNPKQIRQSYVGTRNHFFRIRRKNTISQITFHSFEAISLIKFSMSFNR